VENKTARGFLPRAAPGDRLASLIREPSRCSGQAATTTGCRTARRIRSLA
jgi:hypothetical protein